VVGVEHGGHADTERGGPLHRQFHAHHRCRVAEAAAGVDECRRSVLSRHHRTDVEHQLSPVADALVEHQHGQAVRVDTGQIRVDHDIRRRAGELGVHSPRAQDVENLLPDPLGRYVHRSPLVVI
jgi:hypothetical protein